MDHTDRILGMAKFQPLLPMQVANAIGTDSMLASAMLSELVKKGLLKISNLKVGSSPLYYLQAEKQQLLNYLTYLNEKDKRTVLMLKEKEVVREKTVDPLTRVSLRNIKDFSVPLEVTSNGGKELFWKWYATDEKQAELLIQKILVPDAPVPELLASKNPHDKPGDVTRIFTPEKGSQQAAEYEPISLNQEVKPKEARDVKPEEKPVLELQKELVKASKPKLEKKKKQKTVAGLDDYFKNNRIILLEQQEGGCIIDIDSPVGKLTYYCEAKDKKRVSDADVSSAYVQAQLQKLPCIMLVKGELTKKAQELLKGLKGMKVAKIGS